MSRFGTGLVSLSLLGSLCVLETAAAQPSIVRGRVLVDDSHPLHHLTVELRDRGNERALAHSNIAGDGSFALHLYTSPK